MGDDEHFDTDEEERQGAWVVLAMFGVAAAKPALATFRFEAGRRQREFETELVQDRFKDDVRDGEWEWLRSGKIVSRGQYVDGHAQGRWSCLDPDGDEIDSVSR